MPHINTLQSLDLIIEDVSAEINLAMSSLEQYAESQRSAKPLEKALEHLNRLKGVFTLLEMKGSLRLVLDAISVMNNLHKRKPATRRKLLETLSMALAQLMRYIEYINQKSNTLPELLLPSINNLRASVNATLLGESAFFSCNSTIKRKSKSLITITSDETADKSRHLRQMYQIGLIEVLRKTNLRGGLLMMKKAMAKLDDDCPRPQSPNLWWIAQSLLESFANQSLALTQNRLKLFSRLDRQIRKIENREQDLLEEGKKDTQLLAQEMLYLAWISKSETELYQQLLSHFKLEPALLSDKELKDEREYLRGPTENDYDSISEALLEEISAIEIALKHKGEGEDELSDLENIKNKIVNLNNLLKILQVDNQVLRLTLAIDLMEKALCGSGSLSEREYAMVSNAIKTVKQGVNAKDLASYSGQSRIKRSILSEQDQLLHQQATVQIKKLIQDFSEFMAQNRKVLLIKGIAPLLEKIRESFVALKIEQASPIIEGCIRFVSLRLAREPHSTSQQALDLFADIIGGLEFYLETLSFTAAPSPRIFEFAENSLVKLDSLYQPKGINKNTSKKVIHDKKDPVVF